MTTTVSTALWAAVGVILGLAGIGVLLILRFGRRPGEISLMGVGRISRVTVLVAGLALLGLGYHIVVHALDLMRAFRAPLRLAVGVAIVAIVGSLAIDALENRLAGPPDAKED